MVVVAARDAAVVGEQIAAADGPSADHVHHQAVVEQRRVGVGDAVEDGAAGRVGDGPFGAGQESEESADAVEEDVAVGAGVGDGGVLDEGAVGVEPVAVGDVGKDRGEGVAGEGDLGRGTAEDAAEHDDAAQVDAVGPGAGAGVRAEGRVGDEVVDGGEMAGAVVVGERAAGQVGVEDGEGVEELLRAADLPVPPVAVAVGPGVVHSGFEVVEAGQDGVGEGGVTGESGAGLGVRLGHGVQPGVAAGDPGRRVEGLVGPERRGGGPHGGGEPSGQLPGLAQRAGVRLGGRVDAGAEDEVHPAAAQGGEDVIGGGGPWGGRGGRGGAKDGRAPGGGGEEGAAGPGGGVRHGRSLR